MSHREMLRRPLMAAALTAALALAGCASQGAASAPPRPGSELIGYWEVEGGGSGQTVAQFCEDGTFRVFVRSADAAQRHSGRYQVEGDRIRFAGKGPAEMRFDLAGDRLQYVPVADANPAWMVSDTWHRMSR